jgi:hypothetical protein
MRFAGGTGVPPRVVTTILLIRPPWAALIGGGPPTEGKVLLVSARNTDRNETR